MPYKDIEKRREYGRLYMKQYEKLHVQRRRESNNEYKRQLRAWFLAYKRAHPCIHCGESHPACLDFHHRDPTQKEISLAIVVQMGWSIPHILKELEKCDVLCANCHRKLHWQERFGTELTG